MRFNKSKKDIETKLNIRFSEWQDTEVPDQRKDRVLHAIQRAVDEEDTVGGRGETIPSGEETQFGRRRLQPRLKRWSTVGGVTAGVAACIGIIVALHSGMMSQVTGSGTHFGSLAASSGASISDAHSASAKTASSAASGSSAGSSSGATGGGALHYGRNIKGNHATYILHHYPPSSTPPANEVAQQVEVSLPLYPGAKVTHQDDSQASLSVMSSPYLKAAKAEYLLPVGAAKAKTWVQKELEKYHYQQATSQTSGSTAGLVSQGLGFVYATNHNLTVQASFQSVDKDQTLLVYFVECIQTPARTPGSLVTGDITKIQVTYHPWKQNASVEHKTIVNPTLIQQLVATANHLPLDTRGVHGCAADFGQGAVLDLWTQSGKQIKITIDAACATVTMQGKSYQDSSLWTEITNMMQP